MLETRTTEKNSVPKSVTGKQNPLVQFLRENLGITVGLVILCLILVGYDIAQGRTVFLTTNNIMNVLRQVATNLIIACGMTMVIILGGIDLSVGSVVGLSGCVTAMLIAYNDWPIAAAVCAGIFVGVISGAFNGFVISKTTIPPFIVTLAMMNIARGACYVYTNAQPIRIMSDSFNFIGSGYIADVIPVPVIYLVLVIFISSFIMNRTKLGRHIYAVGGNATAAIFSGIKNGRVLFFGYLFSGVMAAVSGVILASRMFSGQPTAGQGFELDAIAAVVLGGTSMAGGVGKIGGTVIGALIIGVLNNGLNLLNINSFWQLVVKGIVILIAVYADFLKKQSRKI
ncbi:MAG: ABC transporter permease [Treponema sp.]|nr:ABC transporter permease [Treponema sp.]